MSGAHRDEHVVVRRGDRFDVVEWAPGAESPRGAPEPSRRGGASASGIGHVGAGRSAEGSWTTTAFAVFASVLVLAATAFAVLLRPRRAAIGPKATIADLQPVHPGVVVRGAQGESGRARTLRRVAAGDVVETDGDGRARLRLDDGSTVLVDRATRLTLSPTGLSLAHGRVFVQGAPGAHTTVDVGGATALVSGGGAGIERAAREPASAKVYAASGDLTVVASGKEHAVGSGMTAHVNGGGVEVAPERGFEDWTGGLAAPWGAKGPPRRAVGELWGRPGSAPPGDPGSPLTIRAHDVRATLFGEAARTEVRTTYFNAGSEAVAGDFRMALPPGAIVSRFASVRGSATDEGHIALAARDRTAPRPSAEVLEWAGEGWVRGSLAAIPPGTTVTVIVEYVEWLSPRPAPGATGFVVQYRYPMAAEGTPPVIGEMSARIDTTPARPLSLAAGLGARVDGWIVELRRPDFRPTADLVVDVAIEPWHAPARLYVAPPAEDDDGGATLLARTELPEPADDEGVTVALVLDVSGSVDPALLDAGRAVVEAVLAALGPNDRAVVLAADQTVRAVGPPAVGPVDDARRKAVSEALSTLSPGGASDLGRALEAGADALPNDAAGGMVVYVGDGWPTVGDADIERIQARLARRPAGPPRLGAIAIGPVANRLALAALTRGSGPLFEVADSSDAARAAVELVANALRPTVASVSLDLGPLVERTYPRTPRALPAGETAFAVGRVRGELPREVTLSWRDAKGARKERRAVVVIDAFDAMGAVGTTGAMSAADAPLPADVRRRWAAARVEEIALRGRGREAATDVALRAGLLTPWTGWLAGDPAASTYVATPLATRVLDLAVGPDGALSASLATPPSWGGALADDPLDTSLAAEVAEARDGRGADDGMKAALAEAAERTLDAALPAVRACRDSRAALRPELAGILDVAFRLDGDGRASDVRVRAAAGPDDEALDRCVKVVVEGLAFPSSGVEIRIDVRHRVELPPLRPTLRGARCSPTSTLPLPLRRGIWRERLERDRAWDVYLDAKRTCELPTWSDRRALLELVLTAVTDGVARVEVARHLDRAGETDAAALLRRETVRRARTPDELRAVRLALLGDETYPPAAFRERYAAATTHEGRLAVVRRFLAIAPHDARLRIRLLSLLEAMGKRHELADEVHRIRLDPFAGATLLAEAASALRRAGDDAEARRTFGELAERAPGSPFARAFLGDRLRNEGWFAEAAVAYAALDELAPGDPAALVRLALAHAGADRIDLAHRMLARVAQTGGRAGDAKLGELAGHLANALVAEARTAKGVAADDATRLTRAALELPGPGRGPVVLVHAPAASWPIEAAIVRGPAQAREVRPPEIAAPGIGLYALRIDDRAEPANGPAPPGGAQGVVLRLRRPADLAPASPTPVRIEAIVRPTQDTPATVVSTRIDLPIDGKPVELRWTGSAWETD